MTSRRKPKLAWAAVVVTVVGVIALIGPGSREGEPLDPASTGASGAKALVDTMRELGAKVAVPSSLDEASLGAGTNAVLLLVDNLSEDQRELLTGWTETGGTLVVADPSSPLSPGSAPLSGEQQGLSGPTEREAQGPSGPTEREAQGPSGPTEREAQGPEAGVVPLDAELVRDCSVAALERVNTVVSPGAMLLPVPPGATGCFSDPAPSDGVAGPDPGAGSEAAWLVVVPRGLGSIVALGGAGAFANSDLDRADNALLAVDLLVPRQGDEVVVLWVSPAGSGRESLVDLVPAGVKLALLQLGLAFVVVALWRARRLGRPVIEHQPVELEGSEWVAAVGRLQQRARGRVQAAAILRDDLRRTLTTRLGLPADAPVQHVVDAASVRSGIPAQRVLEVLSGEDPRSEDELVGLARSVESLRREVVHGN